LLPAVQKVREAAARSTCGNNLKQISLAAQNYESAQRVFPYGMYTINQTDYGQTNFYSNGGSGVGCIAALLPYLEQDNVYRQLQVSWDPFASSTIWSLNAANTAPARTRIKNFECPSAANDAADGYLAFHRSTISGGGYIWEASAFGPAANLGITNYLGVAGQYGVMGSNITAGGVPVDQLRGVFVHPQVRLFGTGATERQSATSVVLITDGTSNTTMFGESVGHGYASGIPNRLRLSWSWICAGSCPTAFGLQTGTNLTFGQWSSKHSGDIVQFAFCDGSVRSLKPSIAPGTFVALSTIKQGEVVDLSSL